MPQIVPRIPQEAIILSYAIFTIPPSKLSKIKQKKTKIKASKGISKKYQNLNFLIDLTSQTLPKTLPKPSQIEQKSIKIVNRRIKSSKKRPRSAQDVPESDKMRKKCPKCPQDPPRGGPSKARSVSAMPYLAPSKRRKVN